MNLPAPGLAASTGTSILRSNSSMGKSSQSIARFKKKAEYRTVSHFEKTEEQRCPYTPEEKKIERHQPKC